MLTRTARAAWSAFIAASPLPPFPISNGLSGLIRHPSGNSSTFSVRLICSPATTKPRQRIALSPKTDLSRAFLAVALGHLGKAEEAGLVWRELMEINPKYSFAEHVGRLPFRDQTDVDRLVEGLSKAGIPA